MPNWQELATTSHYQTAVAVKDALHTGDTTTALEGLEELIDALSRSDRRALESYLMRLMQHVIKWRVQPERRSASWAATIRTTRRQIARIQREIPSLNRRVIEALWNEVRLAGLGLLRGRPWGQTGALAPRTASGSGFALEREHGDGARVGRGLQKMPGTARRERKPLWAEARAR